MALRLYWNNAAPAVTPGFKGPNWDKTAGAVQKLLGLGRGSYPPSSNTSIVQSKGSTSTTYDVAHGLWVSDPIVRNVTIPASAAETFAVTVGRDASVSSAIVSVIYIYILKPDNTVRGVLWDRVGTAQWTTANGNAGWGAAQAALSGAVTVQVGDRLVVEMGFRGITTSSTPTATIWYGNGGGIDYTITPEAGNETTKVGWIELVGTNLESMWTAPTPTDYYVSAAGSDSNPGTLAQPWLTLNPHYSKLFNPGDTLNLRGGDTFTGLVYISQPGTSDAPIKVRSYGTGKATVTNTTNSGVYIDNVSYVEVDNLIVTGGAGAFSYDGIAYYATGYQKAGVKVTNCDISGWKNGIAIGGDTGGGWSGGLIDLVDVHGNRDQGILTYGPTATQANASITVTNTRAWDNEGNSANTTTHSGSGIVLGSVNGGLIQDSAAWSNGSLCTAPEGPVGIWCYDANAVIIERCLSYNNNTGGSADGDGFDLDIRTTNCEIRYCLAYGNDGAGILVYGGTATAHSGNKIHHNICWGNSKKTDTYYAELTLAGNIGNAQVFHNTLIARDNGAVHPPVISIEDTGQSGATVRNNILRGATGYLVRGENAYTTAQVLFQGNAYEGSGGIRMSASTYASLAAWRAAITGQEQVSGVNKGYEGTVGLVAPDNTPTVTTVAGLTGATDYQLLTTSGVKELGLDLPTLFSQSLGSRDFYNIAPTAPYSIGAHEQDLAGIEPGRRMLLTV